MARTCRWIVSHAIFSLVIQPRVKLWDLWEQFSLFCWLQDRSEQYQQPEAHSNKPVHEGQPQMFTESETVSKALL